VRLDTPQVGRDQHLSTYRRIVIVHALSLEYVDHKLPQHVHWNPLHLFCHCRFLSQWI